MPRGERHGSRIPRITDSYRRHRHDGPVKIARLWAPVAQGQSSPPAKQLEARLEAVEQELASLQQDLSETQERVDFAERMLAQAREGKRIGPAE
jgi:uncharacterized protein YceH (UPF0502 family)